MADTTTTASKGFSRWRASGIHLSISAAIAAVALYVMLRVWYPPPLFSAEGGDDLLFILVAVDVIIGPLITLVIFKSGKPGLRFDLAVIGLLQVTALAYGCQVMFVARPVYIALVDNQFETVRANDLNPAKVALAPVAFRTVPLTGPVYVAVDVPKDIKALRELISQATSGGDLVQHLPQYYFPYSSRKREALENSRPLETLTKDDKQLADRIDEELADTGRKASQLNFLPLQTRRGWGAVLVDAKTGDIVKILPPSVMRLKLATSAQPRLL